MFQPELRFALWLHLRKAQPRTRYSISSSLNLLALSATQFLIAGRASTFDGPLSIRVSERHDQSTGFIHVGGLMLKQFQGARSPRATPSISIGCF
ncbi:hypothetical protein [Vannielia sp.]|uniref:hypothetical protein n=1 Tax=Vannielia sp. TaxID=2813045 RepID=UPI0026176487|nr:hypothetical protein [Vannielia sp.]MDF1873344.1 hypothetical protein [Vannielia sp.]